MRMRLTLAYIGTRYHGWQIQAPDKASQTIQGQLEKALATLAAQPVRAFGSGRTDSGVHAAGQIVHCDMADERFVRIRDWRHALNALLPDDIRVLEVTPAPTGFHARFSAIAKTYRYQFWQERGFTPPRLLPFVWPCGPVASDIMRMALHELLGEHDFASFANAGTPMACTVRTILAAKLTEEAQDPLLPPCLPLLTLTLTGTGFLKQMVRNIAGLLVALGQGHLNIHDIQGFLASKNRAQLPSRTAPAKGLTLLSVQYPATEPYSDKEQS